MTAPELYFHISRALENAGTEDSRFEAMCITEHICGEKLQKIFLRREQISPEKAAQADSIVRKRISGEPLQYLLGEWEFYGMPFYVGEGVLIPRADTETLVEYAVEVAKQWEAPEIIDLCSGSGCIAIAAEKHISGSDITAVELSQAALEYLERNAVLNKSRINIVKGDVLKAETAQQFENIQMILCNPPYLTSWDMEHLQKEVRREPEQALFGGGDGLDFYRKITGIWKSVLCSGGMLIYEIGMGQENSVSEILIKNGFENITLNKDLAGIIRVVSGTKK